MTVPVVYLIRRADCDSEVVKRLLAITPMSAALAVTPECVEPARSVCPNQILALQGEPLAIVADFEHAVTAINDDGSVEVLWPAQSQLSK